MSFSHPEYLRLLLAIPLVVVVSSWAAWRSRRTISLLVGGSRQTEILRILSVKAIVGGALRMIALTALVTAAAGPGWGSVSVEDDRTGIEIVYLFDVSNSMDAEDILPSRLTRAQEIARTVSARLPTAHKAIVTFRGSATTVVPMTDDEAAFEIALGNLSGVLLSAGGTSIESGIHGALSAFPVGSPRRQLAIMFSDGQALQGDLGDVSEELRIAEIPFLVVGTGTRGGATIPTAGGTVIRDESGSPVVARLERESLQRIAELSGGELLDVSDPRIVTSLLDGISSAVGSGDGVLFRRTTEERYELFTFIALVALVIQLVVGARRWRGIV